MKLLGNVITLDDGHGQSVIKADDGRSYTCKKLDCREGARVSIGQPLDQGIALNVKVLDEGRSEPEGIA